MNILSFQVSLITLCELCLLLTKKDIMKKKDNNLNSNKFIIIATTIKQLIASRR